MSLKLELLNVGRAAAVGELQTCHVPGTGNVECQESTCVSMSCVWDLKCGMSGECMCQHVVCLGFEMWDVGRVHVRACRVSGT